MRKAKLVNQMVQAATERGVTAIEFAIVLPVLLMIIFGVINFGVLMYDHAVVTNAAREGARWAAIHSTESFGTSCTNSYSATPVDACQAAYSYAHNRLISFAAVSTIQLTAAKDPEPADFNLGTGQSIKVTYTYTGVGWYFGSTPSTYSSTATMLHE